MQYEIIDISEGVRLYYLYTDKFKSALLGAYFIRPMREVDNPYKALCLRVMKNATEKYKNKVSLNRHMDDMFGTTAHSQGSHFGNNFIMGFNLNILNDKYVKHLSKGKDSLLYNDAMELLYQLILRPKHDGNNLFCKDIVEKEKEKLKELITAQKNETYSYAIKRAVEIMCKDEPASLLPTVEQVEAVNAKALTEYYDELLATSMLNIVYTGATPVDDIINSVREHFSDFKFGVETPLDYSDYKKVPTQIKRETEKCDSMQSKLVIGFRTPYTIFNSSDYYTALMFDQIYGSGTSSKLFVNVREKLGLCYSCASSYNAFTGTLLAHCSISDYNRNKTEKEILMLLEKMRAGEISDFEMKCAKQAIISSYSSISDTPEAMEMYYFQRRVFGIDSDVGHSIEYTNAVTEEQVIDFAKNVVPDTVFFLHGVKNWSLE